MHVPAGALPPGVIVLPPGGGRRYACGPMQSVFLADGEETDSRYSVSIWWVDPNRPGPGAHAHEANDELFFVIEGTMTFLVGDRHVDAGAGTFLRIPAGARTGPPTPPASSTCSSRAGSRCRCRRSSNGTVRRRRDAPSAMVAGARWLSRAFGFVTGTSNANLNLLLRYGSDLRRLEDVGGRPAAGVSVAVPDGSAMDAVRTPRMAFGGTHVVFQSEQNFGHAPDRVAVLLSTDRYDALRTIGSNGTNHGVDTDAIGATARIATRTRAREPVKHRWRRDA